MPSKNTIKVYVEDGYYHLYNRGVEKRSIFEDNQDYQTFLYYLKIYLTPPAILAKEEPLLRLNIVKNNLSDQLKLLAFCLMPNHFHLLVHQNKKDAITRLMRQVATAYSMYFNQKNERIGPLFQGIFKAAQVTSDEYLLHLSRYIHQNPLERGASLGDYQWSSYLGYVGNRTANWFNPKPILDYFNNSKPNFSYQNFVEQNTQDLTKIPHLTLED